jgi:hypothetical protein
MSDWKVIVPSGNLTNLVTNPSFETDTTGWTSIWGDTLARSAEQQKFGAYSLKVTAVGATVGACASITVTAGLVYTFYAWIYIPTTWDGGNPALNVWENFFATLLGSSSTVTERDQWVYRTVSVTPTLGTITPGIYCAGPASTSFYLDGVDCIRAAAGTYTHIDGDQAGCQWNGTEHASTSMLWGTSRAGGIIKDLQTDYYFYIESVLGSGMTPRITSRDGYAQLPGGALNASVRTSRTLTLVGLIDASTLAIFHDRRKALIDLFNPEAFPRTADGWQPVTLRYTGGTTQKEIKVHYEAGLEGDNSWQMPFNERFAIRLFAPDPNWYAIGEVSTALDTNDTATLRYIAGRLKATGQWDDLGLTANPLGGTTVRAICVARDNSVYIGGGFTGWNGNAGDNYIVRYIPATDSYQTLVGAAAVNGLVLDITEGPDGLIYLCGFFTDVGGATGDWIVSYNPTTNAWASLGVPSSTLGGDYVVCMAWDYNNNLYIGGNFTDFAGVGAADYFAKWDGTAWSAVGAGGTNVVSTIAIDASNNIFIGGGFTNWAADGDADYWAWWNGTAWAAVDDIALNNPVQTMVFSNTGELYVGGDFTNAASVANADYIFKWTGTAVEALDIGTFGPPYKLRFAPDGKLWAVGNFTAAGSLSVVDRVAIWNESTWVPPDVNLPGAPVSYAIDFSTPHPDIQENYDVYLAFDTTGAGYFAGDTVVTNGGSIPAYPKIIISRVGGTSARLVSARNANTGKELFCDYSLVDGEVLTIDTSPDAQTVESSFFGSRLDAVLPGSDWSEFQLLPGANTITTFVDVVGAPTIEANLTVKTPYDGVDD